MHDSIAFDCVVLAAGIGLSIGLGSSAPAIVAVIVVAASWLLRWLRR